MAFFKVADDDGQAGEAAPGSGTTTQSSGDGQEALAGATGNEPVAQQATDDNALPAYQDPAESAPNDSGEAEEAFTPPAWIDRVAPESREEALKFAKGQYERTQKERKQASAAKQERDAKAKELEEAKGKLKEFETAPLPVAVPELVLPDLRTTAEVDAFVESAPAKLAESSQWWRNCAEALAAIEKDGEVEMFGRKWTEADVPAIEAEQAKAAAEHRTIEQRLAAAPKRRSYLEKFDSAKQEAAKVYPDLFKGDSAMAKAFKAELKDAPSLAASPKHHVIIGDHLMMNMVRANKYRLVSVAPKAGTTASTTTAPGSAQATAAPLPRTGEPDGQRDAQALKAKAAAGDREAQEKLRLSYFKVA